MPAASSRAPISRAVRRRRTLVIAGAVAALAVVSLVAGVVSAQPSASVGQATTTQTATLAPEPTATPRPSPSASPEPVVVPTFDMAARSIDDPASIWVVSNKQRPLNPVDYEPADLVEVPVAHTWSPLLRQEASDAVVAMFDAAATEAGLNLASNSAYRSYSTQVEVYDQDVAANGQAFADTSTARPGHSEHQTGLAIDIGAESGSCSLGACFGETAEGQWLVANAWRFGYLLRYPADKTEITGFSYEPWHFRYIGVDLATEMHNTGVTTLEEFFGLPAAPDYS
ncbi:M15 family metallopeptidase [Glaciibacter superstes]|uniref:M15 family metallopeptidase n=1 Tax=Glaciibacter superstes TaxID=501023 RepID=UPI001FE08173|nr:M15 family metallopeptidase [Glaciibacter superstes]